MKEHHNSETEKLRMDTDNKRRCEIETDRSVWLSHRVRGEKW